MGFDPDLDNLIDDQHTKDDRYNNAGLRGLFIHESKIIKRG
jgi:hypothetical protein